MTRQTGMTLTGTLGLVTALVAATGSVTRTSRGVYDVTLPRAWDALGASSRRDIEAAEAKRERKRAKRLRDLQRQRVAKEKP